MDVKELLIDKNIEYISRGRDYSIRCLNPEHEDTNPSLNIDKITGIMHCYSCGFAGDIFTYFNINKEKFINIKIQKVREKIHDLLSTKSIPMPLDITYVNTDYRGISKSTLRKFGAFTTESLKGMEGRIVFPITNINRDVIGFQGRYMYSDLDPKYKFYPEHVSLPLFPSIVIPIKGTIILVEGIFDMINLHDKGLHNAVCTFGTAFGSVRNKHKKQNNINKLLNFKYQGIEKIYIMYDADKSGKDATKNLMEYAGSSFNMEDIILPEGQDPGALTKPDVDRLYGVLYE
jgi:DNA primase